MWRLMGIPKEDFSDCYGKWKKRWDKCVKSRGGTLKGTRLPVLYICYLLTNNKWLDTFWPDFIHCDLIIKLTIYCELNTLWFYELKTVQ